MTIGLCSVSFRSLGREEVVAAAAAAGITQIEWGADVHVPAGDLAAARHAAALCRDAGIAIPSYGSYYRLGTLPKEEQAAARQALCDSAETLGASLVRVWAGTKGSAAVPDAERAALTAELAAFRAYAEARGLRVAPECHMATLCDTPDSARRLAAEAGTPLYWQPFQTLSTAENERRAALFAPHVCAVHVFNWAGKAKYPLADAVGVWRGYRAALGDADVPFYLEFMPHGSPAELAAEADALRAILAK